MAGLSAALWLGACSYVEVERVDGTRENYWQLGAVVIDPPNEPAARLARTEGVGVVKAGGDFTLGYFAADYAFLDDSCRLVLWVEDPKQVKRSKELLGQVEDLCVFGPD